MGAAGSREARASRADAYMADASKFATNPTDRLQLPIFIGEMAQGSLAVRTLLEFRDDKVARERIYVTEAGRPPSGGPLGARTRLQTRRSEALTLPVRRSGHPQRPFAS